jgi:oligosaccharyltransferase complex subunit beta
VEFVSKGGNVLLTASPSSKRTVQKTASEFGIILPEDLRTAAVSDFFSKTKKSKPSTTIWTKSFSPSFTARILSKTKAVDTISFPNGVGHSLDKENALVFPVLFGTATTSVPAQGTRASVGTDLPLISVLQARNNARFSFIGSTELFSNE